VPDIDQLQAQANRLLGGPDMGEATVLTLTETSTGEFSPFVPQQLEKALEVAARLMRTADTAAGEEGLEAALDEAERLAPEHPAGLVEHALQLFIVHHPQGSLLSIPPIQPLPEDQRRPEAVVAGTEEAAEAALDYLRGDLVANDHHRHWHLVYPSQGVPDANGQPRLQDRQGELFFYMHQQMLARYDAERLSHGLERVKAFSDYRQPIIEGYGDRPGGQQLVDVNRRLDRFPLTITVADLEAQRDALFEAVDSGEFKRPDAELRQALHALGAEEEPLRGSRLGFWHHGAGHMITAWVMHPNEGGQPGAIGNTATAIRDPFFWRWHRHVDDLGYRLQEQFDEHRLDDAPPVTIRGQSEPGGPDLILCFENQLPEGDPPDLAVLQAWAEEIFGGARFEQPPDAAHSTSELRTHMTFSPLDPTDPGTSLEHHLDHEPFAVLVRLKNTGQERRRVTVRLFIAPEELAEDRRSWIEMDKFDSWLEPATKTVLVRPMRFASVVRKPVSRPPQFMQSTTLTRREQYCRCGWPYHLLLPRGTPEGMPFQLAAVVTDFAHDHISGNADCGSLSFCGSLSKEFPDRREMGYPFNRPFRTRTITQTLVEQHNMAARSFTIKHDEDGEG
jgi:Hemocyanin, ig-like domain/Hemocyanin, copper containing domain